MRRTAFLLVALTVVGLLGAACADGRGDVEAGDCFEAGTAAKFDWDSEVSCNQPHTVEVFAVLDVSDTLGQFPRGNLDDKTSSAREQYVNLLTSHCEPAWSEYTGYGDLGSSLAPEAVVLPAIYGDMALEAAPDPEWAGGNQIVICYQVLGKPGAQGADELSVQHPVLATLARDPAAVPIEVRDCARAPAGDQGEQQVSCTRQHDREYLGHLDLAQFTGRVPDLNQSFLDRFDATAAADAEWEVLDGLCEQVFSDLLGDRREGVSLRAQVYTGEGSESWGWADAGSYHAACFAETAQITTSIFG